MSTLFDLMVKIGVDDSAFSKGLADAKTKALSAGSGIAKGLGGTAMKGLGMAAQAGAAAIGAATTAVTAFGASSVKAGMTFDTSMSQVAATMGYTTAQLNDSTSEASKNFTALREFAQKMGSETAFSASQSADALNYMALAGYDAETSMEMLPNVLNLAAAGGIELAAASDMVTDAQSALGLNLDQTSELVDKMAKASSKSNTSVAQLGDAILTVGGTAKSLAGGTTELSTALGLLADNGIKGAEGGTALRNIILALSAPTNTAAKKLSAMGVSAYDASGKLRPLQDVFADLNEAMEPMTQEERTDALNTIFNKVDLKSANALLATSADRWEELSGAIDNASGAAENMAKTQLDNLNGDVTLFKSALEGVQIAISNGLTPTLRKFVQMGTGGLERINNAYKRGGLSEAFSEAGGALADITRDITAMVPDIVHAAGELLNGLAEGFAANAGDLADAAVNIVGALAEGISKPDAILTLIEGVDQMLGQLATRMEEADPSEFAAGLESIVSRAATSLGDNAAVLLPAAAKLVGNLALALTAPDNIQTLIGGATDLITGLGTGLVDAAPELAGRVPEILDNLVTGFDQSVPELLGKLAGSLNNMLTKLFDPSNINISGIMKSLLTGRGFDMSQLFAGAWLQSDEQGRTAGQQFLDAYYETVGAGKGSSTHESKGGGTYGGGGGSWGPAKEVANEARAAAQEAAEVTNEAQGFVGRARVTIDEANAAAQAAAANTTQAAANAAQAAATVTTATQTVANATGQAQTEMANSTQAAAGALTTTAANAQKAGNTVTQAMNQAAATVSWDTLIESSQVAAQGVQDAFKETPDWFGRQFQIAAENIKSAFAPLPGEFAAIWQLIKNAFKVSEAQTWGRDMIQGFTNGVNALKPTLIASIEDLAAKVKAILGHSHPTEGPMKDDYTWMPDMMDLFISGIRDNEDRLQQTAAHAFDLSDSVTEPTMTYSTASAGGGSASGEAYSLEAKLDQVLTLLNAELPQLANRSVVLDTGAVVGGILPQVDAGLGRRYAYAGRDNA